MVKFCKKCGVIITTNELMIDCFYCRTKLTKPIWKNGVLVNKRQDQFNSEARRYGRDENLTDKLRSI